MTFQWRILLLISRMRKSVVRIRHKLLLFSHGRKVECAWYMSNATYKKSHSTYIMRIRHIKCRMQQTERLNATSKSHIQHKLSIKVLICIKSYAQSVFDIVRPFGVLAVECNLKRSHIAFDTTKLPSFFAEPCDFLPC